MAMTIRNVSVKDYIAYQLLLRGNKYMRYSLLNKIMMRDEILGFGVWPEDVITCLEQYGFIELIVDPISLDYFVRLKNARSEW